MSLLLARRAFDEKLRAETEIRSISTLPMVAI